MAWRHLCDTAANALNTISTYVSNYGVVQTVIMRDRYDTRLAKRSFQQERALGQETYAILRQGTGASRASRQALLLLPWHCQNNQMSDGAILDLCLVQTQGGMLELFSPPADSPWRLRITEILDNIMTDFHELNFGHLPRIEQDPALKHLSVDVTTYPKTQLGRVQARTGHGPRPS